MPKTNEKQKNKSSVNSDSSSEENEVIFFNNTKSKKSPSASAFQGTSSDDDSPSRTKNGGISHDVGQKRTPRSSVKQKRIQDSSSSSSSSLSSQSSYQKAPPIRKSPRKSIFYTKQNIKNVSRYEKQSLDSDSGSIPSVDIKIYSGTRKKFNQEEDDESYSGGESENDSNALLEDRYLSSGNEDDSVSSENDEQQSNKADYLSFDDDADSDDNQDKQESKRIRITPLKIRKSKRKRKVTGKIRDVLSQEKERKMSVAAHESAPRRLPPRCSSTHDEVTMDPLPPLHVCYLAPDGKTRHCYCLETIYRASIMSGIKRKKDDRTGKLQFLQPPHFRTVMEADLLDEIASRFGRQALVIEESDIFKKENHLLQLRSEFRLDEDTSQVNFALAFGQYLKRQMGTGDVYCCPICYCEAQRRFNGHAEEDDSYSSDDDREEENEEDSTHNYSVEKITSSKYDPMSILGALDDDLFDVASTFCFLKLSLVKKHIQTIHELDSSMVSGNEFYQRFMIRAQDGLLQRHLHTYWKDRIFGSAMQRYWLEGHNQSFVLLRTLIDRRQYMIDGDVDFEESDFSSSFRVRAAKIWSYIIAPYAHSKSDDSDFIDDDVVDDEEYGSHPVFEKPEDIEDEFVAHLRRKRENLKGRKRHGYESTDSNDSDYDDLDDEDDDLIIIDDDDSKDHVVVDESSSEDEWVSAKRQKALSKHPTPTSTTRIKKKRTSQTDDEDDEIVFVTSSAKRAKAHQTLNSSSDEEDAILSKKRGKILFESDEE